jgi:hypothetical protein
MRWRSAMRPDQSGARVESAASHKSARVPPGVDHADSAVGGQPAVSHVDGVLLSMETVSDLLNALDALQSLAGQRGARVPARIAKVRDALLDCTTRVRTRAASRRVTAALELGHTELGLIDTAAASSRLGIAEDSVRDLCRRNRLAAMRIEGRWWIAEDSVIAYSQERKGA